MQLHRFAVVSLIPPPSEIDTTFRLLVGDVLVGISATYDLQGSPSQSSTHPPTIAWWRHADSQPARVVLHATATLQVSDGNWSDLDVPREALSDVHKAIAYVANLLAIASQAEHSIVSPRPYLFLQPESDDERAALGTGDGIRLPKLGSGGVTQAPGPQHLRAIAEAVKDRPQGVALLGSALAAGHGIGKLHELVRVFENAFATSGARLVKPLTAFLQSAAGDHLDYRESEVKAWVKELRDPAIHADLRQATRVVSDPDVEPVIPRMEQAAYDVLLNKKHWHRSDSERQQRVNLAGTIDSTGGAHVSGLSTLRMWDDWDQFGAFRLQESGRLTPSGSAEEWIPIDWYRRTNPIESGTVADS